MTAYQNYNVRYEGDADAVIERIERALGADAIHHATPKTQVPQFTPIIHLGVYLDQYFSEQNPPKNPGLYEDAEPVEPMLKDINEVTLVQTTFGA